MKVGVNGEAKDNREPADVDLEGPDRDAVGLCASAARHTCSAPNPTSVYAFSPKLATTGATLQFAHDHETGRVARCPELFNSV